jgi:hypothetical protein
MSPSMTKPSAVRVGAIFASSSPGPSEKETQFKIIDPPTARLGPGETAHFKTSFDHPDEAATGVLVTFAR